jgi:site-specific DNA recombinase
MTSSYSALAYAIEKKGPLARVPSFAPNWLPDQGSNLGPAD